MSVLLSVHFDEIQYVSSKPQSFLTKYLLSCANFKTSLCKLFPLLNGDKRDISLAEEHNTWIGEITATKEDILED